MKKNNNLAKLVKSKKFKDNFGPAMFLTRVSTVIYDGRVEKKLSQVKLAKEVKTTQRIISEIENGNYNMGSDLFYRIFKFLGKPLISDGVDLISGKKINLYIHYNYESNTLNHNENFGNEFKSKTITQSLSLVI